MSLEQLRDAVTMATLLSIHELCEEARELAIELGVDKIPGERLIADEVTWMRTTVTVDLYRHDSWALDDLGPWLGVIEISFEELLEYTKQEE
ncbi:hypothetical protein VPHD69_0127 [Vibrio phage D69]